MARRPLLSSILLAVLVAAGPAVAHDDKGRRRPPPVTKPADVVAPKRLATPTSPPGVGLPMQSGGGFAAGSLAANGLAFGGLRSSLPAVGDKAAECRTGCAQTRLTCDAQDATPDCAPRWAQCVATCNR